MATPVFYLFSDRFFTSFFTFCHFWTPENLLRKHPPGRPKTDLPDSPDPPKSKKRSKNTSAKTTYDEKVVFLVATPEKW